MERILLARLRDRKHRVPADRLPCVLALALLSSVFVTHQAASQAQAPSVTVATPVVREVVEDDEFIGRFDAVDQVDVRARVGGYLEDIHFADGQMVSEGDLLFTIDQRIFRLSLEQAQSQEAVSRTQFDFAQAQLERAQELAQRGNISAAVLDERRQEFLSAQASLEGASAAVALAAINLEYTEVRAPISGRIDRRRVSGGNLVLADQTVLTSIVSIDPIDFYFDVDERTFLNYSRDAQVRGGALQMGAGGLPVVVRVDERDATPIEGALNFAENRADEASGTIRLRARFPNADGIIQPGLFGRINVPGSLPYTGIMVPDEAVGSDQDRRIVYILNDDNSVTARPVQPGPRLHGYRVIRRGLEGNETVVVNGLMRIRPGVTVNPQRVDLPPTNEGAEG